MTIIEAIREAKEMNCKHIMRKGMMSVFVRGGGCIRIPDAKTDNGPLIVAISDRFEGVKIPYWSPFPEDILADDWIVASTSDEIVSFMDEQVYKGRMSLNEARARIGLSPINSEEADLHWVPVNGANGEITSRPED